jgi:hypothetical protein
MLTVYCCQKAAAATATAAASSSEISQVLSELQRECSASKVQAVNSAEALVRVIAVAVCNGAHSVAVETAAAATANTALSFDAEKAASSKAAGNAHFAQEVQQCTCRAASTLQHSVTQLHL